MLLMLVMIVSLSDTTTSSIQFLLIMLKVNWLGISMSCQDMKSGLRSILFHVPRIGIGLRRKPINLSLVRNGWRL